MEKTTPTEQDKEKEASAEEKQTTKASVLNDWNYVEHNGGYLSKEYKGKATNIVIPAEITGKQVYVETKFDTLTNTTTIEFP